MSGCYNFDTSKTGLKTKLPDELSRDAELSIVE